MNKIIQINSTSFALPPKEKYPWKFLLKCILRGVIMGDSPKVKK